MSRPPFHAYAPPLRVRDWLVGAVVAGCALGAGEAALTRMLGDPLGERLVLALAAASALLVAVPTALAGVVGRGFRQSGSALAAAGVVGMVAAPLVEIATRAIDGFGAWATSLLVAFAAVGAATLSAALAARRERWSGKTIPVVPTWALTALAVAVAERGLHGDGGGVRAASGLLALAVGGAILLVLLQRALSRQGDGPPPLVRAAVGFSLLIGGAAFWPTLQPWLGADPLHRSAAPERPALLVCVLPPGFLVDEPHYRLDSVAHTAVGGVSLRARGSDVASFDLTRPGTRPLFRTLAERGYRTAAVLPETRRSVPSGVTWASSPPTPERALRGEAGHAAGRAFLAWVAHSAGWLNGSDGRASGPAATAREAERWLTRWRASDTRAPFALYVDLRGAGGASAPVAAGELDASLGSLLDALDELGLWGMTVLVLVEPAAEAGAPARAIVAPAARVPRDGALVSGSLADVIEAALRGRPGARRAAP